jgi:hypothetical protein
LKVFALLLIFWATGAAAQMYKCVDERGVTHYADKPTAGCRNSAVEIQGSPPISGRLSAPADSTAQQEADFRRRLMEREQSQRAQRAEQAVLDSRCANLRQEQAMLGSGRRVVKINAKGEREYLDDSVRDARLAEIRGALEKCR